MKFAATQVMNFDNAFHGLRNPMNSWRKSDSSFGLGDENNQEDFNVAHLYCLTNGITLEDGDHYDQYVDKYASWLRKNGILKYTNDNIFEYAYIGPEDLNLAQRMIKAGSSDRKFMRQIFVSVDITAPLYWQTSFCQ